MVIPLPANMMGPPLDGPIPPEVASLAKQIKLCTLAIFAVVVVKLVALIAFGECSPSGSIFSILSNMINPIIGVFLLNDDEHLKQIYDFMVSTCFQQCHAQNQCRGGLSCLLSWTLVNAVGVIMGLIFGLLSRVSAEIDILINGGGMMENGEPMPKTMLICVGISLATTLINFLAQLFGAIAGWRAHTQIRDRGTEMVPSSWAEEQNQAPTGGGRPPSTNWGGGRLGDGGSSDPPPRSTPPRQQNFEAFAGTGQRLGGE